MCYTSQAVSGQSLRHFTEPLYDYLLTSDLMKTFSAMHTDVMNMNSLKSLCCGDIVSREIDARGQQRTDDLET